jgi:hypothetical protein
MMESRVPPSVRLGLTHKGHDIELLGPFSTWLAVGQSVMRDCATRRELRRLPTPAKDGAAHPRTFL